MTRKIISQKFSWLGAFLLIFCCITTKALSQTKYISLDSLGANRSSSITLDIRGDTAYIIKQVETYTDSDKVKFFFKGGVDLIEFRDSLFSFKLVKNSKYYFVPFNSDDSFEILDGWFDVLCACSQESANSQLEHHRNGGIICKESFENEGQCNLEYRKSTYERNQSTYLFRGSGLLVRANHLMIRN
jgi:hypothetical protein